MKTVILIGGFLAPLWVYKRFALHLLEQKLAHQIYICATHGGIWTNQPSSLEIGRGETGELQSWQTKTTLLESAARILEITQRAAKQGMVAESTASPSSPSKPDPAIATAIDSEASTPASETGASSSEELIIIGHSLGCLIALYLKQMRMLPVHTRYVLVAPAFCSTFAPAGSKREYALQNILRWGSGLKIPLGYVAMASGLASSQASRATDEPMTAKLYFEWKRRCHSIDPCLLSQSIDWICSQRGRELRENRLSWDNVVTLQCTLDQVVSNIDLCPPKQTVKIKAPHDPFNALAISIPELCSVMNLARL